MSLKIFEDSSQFLVSINMISVKLCFSFLVSLSKVNPVGLLEGPEEKTCAVVNYFSGQSFMIFW